MAAADLDKSQILQSDASHARDWDRYTAVKRPVPGRGVVDALHAKLVIQRDG